MSVSFDPAALRALADLLNESGLSEIELEEGGKRLRLARVIAPVTLPVAPVAPLAAASHPAPLVSEPAIPVRADPAKHAGVVKSPMVGVAYLSAEPGAAPYVSVGQAVAAGDTLLLIEAMKTFNQIKAPKAGVVTQILVLPGAPVEYDEPLVIVE